MCHMKHIIPYMIYKHVTQVWLPYMIWAKLYESFVIYFKINFWPFCLQSGWILYQFELNAVEFSLRPKSVLSLPISRSTYPSI